MWAIFRPIDYWILWHSTSWLNKEIFSSFMQVRIVKCKWIGRKRNSLKWHSSYFWLWTKAKPKVRTATLVAYDFFLFMWPNSFQITVPLILLDLGFMLTFSSWLPIPASFQRSVKLIGTNLVFHSEKLPQKYWNYFFLDRPFLNSLLWLHGIENKPGSDCHAELLLAVLCADLYKELGIAFLN